MFEVFDNRGSTSLMYQRSKCFFPHFRFGHFRNINPRPLFNTNIFLISAKYGLRNHFWPLENGFLMRKKSSRRNISTNAYILKSLSWSIGNITTYWEIVLGFFGLQSRCVVHLNSSEAVLVILESYCAFWGVGEQKVLEWSGIRWSQDQKYSLINLNTKFAVQHLFPTACFKIPN